jgi:beta-phosphoglucomutase-like phosphatase (HAD superfamily)
MPSLRTRSKSATIDLKTKLDNLNAQKDAELLNTTLTASQRRAIEKKYKIEEAQEKEKAWKADQKAKAEQTIINGLLAFSMSLAQQGYPAGLASGLIAIAQAAVQAGIIMSKTPPKFAKGVVALDGPVPRPQIVSQHIYPKARASSQPKPPNNMPHCLKP